jgi:glutamine amidotransferase
MMRVSLIEYGIGNVQSVANALERLHASTEIARDGDELLRSSSGCIILPGVGAAGEALRLLRQRGLDTALDQLAIRRKVPFLGICVGMQMMAEICEEFGEHRGLGWIPGRVRRLPAMPGLRLPHVGWNTIRASEADSFLANLDGEHFYFVHTYAINCPAKFVVATSEYGAPFVAAVRCDNLHGVQFHPEKSSHAGERLLQNFLTRAEAAVTQPA